MTKLTTTMVDSEWQRALKWRERFLDPEREDAPITPLDPQMVCFLVADCMTMRQFHDEQEALASAPAAPQGWQPIESAPNPNGDTPHNSIEWKSFLVWVESNACTYCVVRRGGKFDVMGGGLLQHEPTHWLPLPLAPWHISWHTAAPPPHTCHDMNPPFPGPCRACAAESAASQEEPTPTSQACGTLGEFLEYIDMFASDVQDHEMIERVKSARDAVKTLQQSSFSLGQGWVSRVTTADGPEVSVIGADVAPMPCKARRCSTPEPQDCDWPFCGCDPHATKVIETLDECGMLRGKVAQEEPTQANSAGLIERLQRCVSDFQAGRAGEWGGSVTELLTEALEALSSSAPVERPTDQIRRLVVNEKLSDRSFRMAVHDLLWLDKPTAEDVAWAKGDEADRISRWHGTMAQLSPETPATRRIEMVEEVSSEGERRCVETPIHIGGPEFEQPGVHDFLKDAREDVEAETPKARKDAE